MRTLVEQTYEEAKHWLGKRLWSEKSDHKDKVGLHLLMGGEEAGVWDTYPEADAILIGTQDMLLSRALNRGYGMSRYRWPMHFGLLNNDCLWVMDETQLMGVGVETSAQLDAFRQRLGVQAPSHHWWMSATLESSRLATVDHPAPIGGWSLIALNEGERQQGEVQKRYQARKILAPAPVTFASSNADDTKRYQKDLAAFIAEKHVPETLTLVVINRVPRAQEIYEQLAKSPPEGAAIALIHSRFRPDDRTAHETILFDKGKSRIVIATQAVEAGVDVSARTLITELAPWSSLVQRFGRCNRYGEWNDKGGAEIFWADLPTASDKDTTPYTKAELDAAREVLETLAAAGPQSLQGIGPAEKPVDRPVIRRKDFIDLFDTTADLCGADLDISRYVRDGDDTDVQVYWREIGAEGPSHDEESPDRKQPTRKELCRVAVDRFSKFLETKSPRIWRWNALEERWEVIRSKQRAIPGAIYLLATDQGGYNETLGWTGVPKHCPAALPPSDSELGAYGGNRSSFSSRRWIELRDHVDHVVAEVDRLSAALSLPAGLAGTLHTAAEWHDAGKAHEVFQTMLHAGAPEQWQDKLLAKSGNNSGHCERTGFRHELASALLWLQLRAETQPDGDLIAYLIGAHHGKVRLSIRALPGEEPKPPRREDGTERLFARGVWQDDRLPASSFGSMEIAGERIPSTVLELSYMRLGRDEGRGDSWLARMIRLRDATELGPMRLAYLETLLRVADWRASSKEGEIP